MNLEVNGSLSMMSTHISQVPDNRPLGKTLSLPCSAIGSCWCTSEAEQIAGAFMKTLLVSVFYLMDLAEPLPLWDRGLEGNPHLSVNINVDLGFGWLLCLVFWEERVSSFSCSVRRHMNLLWISFLLAHWIQWKSPDGPSRPLACLTAK